MIRPGWERCVVVAAGPSLPGLIDGCAQLHECGWKTIAVNDAWQLAPWAEVLWATDLRWWRYHRNAVESFNGERWSSHALSLSIDDHKQEVGAELGLRLVGARADDGFSLAPGVIHYGNNSGFAAVNLAIQFGAREIRLAGFDMRHVDGRSHYFGEHPPEIAMPSRYESFVQSFSVAAQMLPPEIEVINCTPGSALRCFPFAPIAEGFTKVKSYG